LVIGIWPATSSVESDFDIVWNLSIVIWDFSAVFGKANHFYLNQLEADFDVSLIPYPRSSSIGSPWKVFTFISLSATPVPELGTFSIKSIQIGSAARAPVSFFPIGS